MADTVNTGPRLAIGQLRMRGTIDEHLAAIVAAVELAHARGAAVCTFPELAVTGFHRQAAAQAQPGLVAPAVARLQALCARLGVALAVGAPSFGAAEARCNNHLFIDETGALAAVVAKAGLTAPEATFFQPGAQRPVSMLQGLRCSAVICREIEDEAQVCAQLLPGSGDLVFWPGQIRRDPDLPPTDPPRHVLQAQQLARVLGAHADAA